MKSGGKLRGVKIVIVIRWVLESLKILDFENSRILEF